MSAPIENHPSRAYLGDGVYAALDEFGDVVVTTENGMYATNTIVMQPEVLENFERWLARQKADAGDKP
jgi:hypothetical protein